MFKSLDNTMEIKVYDNTTKEIIGVSYIKLKDYRDQVKREEVLKLKAASSSDQMGEIRIRIRILWSRLEYFKAQIKIADEKLDSANKESQEVSKYLNLLDQPFGIIIYGEIDNIFTNDILEIPKEKQEILQKQRMSVLPVSITTGKQNTASYADKLDQALRGTFSKIVLLLNFYLGTDVQWSGVSKGLMYTMIILTFIQMIERSDFTGLTIGLIIWYLFIQQSGLSILDHVKKLIIAMSCICVYDAIWLFTHYDVRIF